MEPSSSATVRSARGLAGLPSLATTYTSSTIRPDALQTKGSVPTPSTLRVVIVLRMGRRGTTLEMTCMESETRPREDEGLAWEGWDLRVSSEETWPVFDAAIIWRSRRHSRCQPLQVKDESHARLPPHFHPRHGIGRHRNQNLRLRRGFAGQMTTRYNFMIARTRRAPRTVVLHEQFRYWGCVL
ncbi:unnamed protein product [Zymoseptoria tritici ST99CH_1E4]|uniref:Uncharacterized protein n=1 Tax=Zymoseptoria tritici ST99CH_1E4 TaxID=1276532 RepID=A0A2H1GGV6_ZYMTR|nr:unnamed protein product [Zymoseptoria tritici ST99CH_1E4]